MRNLSYLDNAIKEMELIAKMSEPICNPEDFELTINGLTIFRACGMSIQFVTESFVKIRNICGKKLFSKYPKIPWEAVFGMRNFLSHEYEDVDSEAIFATIKEDIPSLLVTARIIREDLTHGKLNEFFHDESSES